MGRILSIFLVTIGLAVPAVAQDDLVLEPEVQFLELSLVLTEGQREELEDWIDDARKYHEWRNIWYNRIERFKNGRVARERRQEPPAPEYLPGMCLVLDLYENPPDGLLNDACIVRSQLLAEVGKDPVVIQAQQIQRQNEIVPKTTFWKRLHLDGAWTMSQTGAGVYGLIGAHFTFLNIAKRVQLYIPPGFILLSTPDGKGGRKFSPAGTWGVSIKLFKYDFPGTAGTSIAYFNFAKAWTFGGVEGGKELGVRAGYDMVGLSITFGDQ